MIRLFFPIFFFGLLLSAFELARPSLDPSLIPRPQFSAKKKKKKKLSRNETETMKPLPLCKNGGGEAWEI